MYYVSARHDNYAKEAVYVLRSINTLMTPILAEQIKWSRTVNINGGQSRNIPVDLHNEHLNRALQDTLSGLGSNVSPDMFLQAGKSIKGISDVVNGFDQASRLHGMSSSHSRAKIVRDEDTILQELLHTSKVFSYIPGRPKLYNYTV